MFLFILWRNYSFSLQIKNLYTMYTTHHFNNIYFSTVDSRYLEFDETMEKIRVNVVRLKRSYEDTGSVVCLTTKGRQLERNFEELKPASHVPILGTILNIFDVFVAVFFSPLNSLNLVKRLITSRYLFLCEWICLSVLFMFFTCCIVIKLHPSWRIFLCAILFIYNKWCVFIIQ